MAMSLKNISTVDTAGPLRVSAYSLEGWGKTTFGNSFPRPIFLAPEDGFPRDIDPVPQTFEGITSWADVLDAVDVLINDEHDFETLVVDSLDWVEPLCHEFICQRDSGRKTEMNKGGHKLESIEDYGYGKGYVVAAEEFRRLLAKLIELRQKRGMHVVILSHAQVKKFSNPEGEDYDRWEAKVHGKVSRLFVEWADAYLFGHYEVASGKIEDEKKAKGVSTGRRMFGTRHNATYDAKNRLGMPDKVPVTLEGMGDLVKMMISSGGEAATGHARVPAASKPAPSKAREREEAPRDPGGTAAAKTAAAAERIEERQEAAREPEPKKPKGKKPAAEEREEGDINSPASWRIRIGDKLDSPLMDPKYVKKVQGWVNDAGDDVKKLESVFSHVVKNS